MLEEIIAQVERILRVGLTVISAYLVALWIASIWWTFRDIRTRTTDLFLQVAATLLVGVFSFAGLLIYIILRPPKTLTELYEESLEEEAFLQGIHVQSACPVCKQRAEPDFIFCPWCQTRLKRLCSRCEHPLMLRSEEHTSELQSRQYLVCRLLLEKKKTHVSTPASRCYRQ